MIAWAGRLPAHGDDEGEQVWIDRYDALNLLSALPPSLLGDNDDGPPEPPVLDVGFEDLEDDAEEMFYFAKEERDDIERERKRRKLEHGREERMKALQAEEEENEGKKEVEETEPSETQLALMKKLHQTLSTSPDPALLEMRILANHGKDERFGFLRKGGKWRDVWDEIRAGEFEKKKEEEEKKGDGNGLGLGGYGSGSDEEEEGRGAEEEGKRAKAEEAPSTEPRPIMVEEMTEEERIRRAKKAEKVKVWARKRKEARELEGAQKEAEVE